MDLKHFHVKMSLEKNCIEYLHNKKKLFSFKSTKYILNPKKSDRTVYVYIIFIF